MAEQVDKTVQCALSRMCNWSDLAKFQVAEIDDTLPMAMAALPNTIDCDLGVKPPAFPVLGGVDFENEMCLWNKSVIYSTSRRTEPGEGGWERLTRGDRWHSESGTFGIKGKTETEAASSDQPSSDVKEEDVMNNIVLADFTLIPDSTKKTMEIFLEEMKFVCMIYDVCFQELLEEPQSFAGDSLEGIVDHVLTDPPYHVRENAEWTYICMTSPRLRT